MPAHPDNLKQAKEVSRPEIVFSVARVPDSSRLYLACSDFKVYDIDLAAEKPEAVALGAHGSYVTGIALAGPHVVSGGYDGKLIWWNRDTRQQVRSVDAHARWIRRVVATRDGSIVASVADDMVCRLWDAHGGQLIRELRGHETMTPHHYPSMLYAVAISADQKYIATGDKVGHIVIWEIASGQPLGSFETPVMYTWDPRQRRHSIGGVRALAFSPDSQLLAVGGMGQVGNIDHLEGKTRVEVFDWRSGQRTHEFPGDQFAGLVNHLEFHPEGKWLLGAGGAGEGFLLFYDLAQNKVLKQEKMKMHVHHFALSETAETLYAVGHQRVLMMTLS